MGELVAEGLEVAETVLVAVGVAGVEVTVALVVVAGSNGWLRGAVTSAATFHVGVGGITTVGTAIDV